MHFTLKRLKSSLVLTSMSRRLQAWHCTRLADPENRLDALQGRNLRPVPGTLSRTGSGPCPLPWPASATADANGRAGRTLSSARPQGWSWGSSQGRGRGLSLSLRPSRYSWVTSLSSSPASSLPTWVWEGVKDWVNCPHQLLAHLGAPLVLQHQALELHQHVESLVYDQVFTLQPQVQGPQGTSPQGVRGLKCFERIQLDDKRFEHYRYYWLE